VEAGGAPPAGELRVAARHLLACAVLAGAGLVPAPAAAQFRVDLAPGTPVRIARDSSPQLLVVGAVVRATGDTLVFHPRSGPHEGSTAYAVRDLASLEIRSGRDRRRGALIGAALAVAVGAVAGGIDHSRGELSSAELAGTLVGNALAGGVIGFALAPRAWRKLPLPGRAPAPASD
jgi:hypothetical protein